MKNAIYISIAAILVLVGFSVLLLYELQPFSEDLKFVKEINYSLIEIQTGPNYYDQESLNILSAKSSIGSVNLENQGYFTQIYVLPNLVGCIEFSSSVNESSNLKYQDQFSVSYLKDGSMYYPGSKIKVSPEEKEEVTILAQYTPYNIPSSEFTRNTIKSISIYNIPEKAYNPLGTDYEYGRYGFSSCSSIKNDYKPEEIILIK